jgi:hypothetical protein
VEDAIVLYIAAASDVNGIIVASNDGAELDSRFTFNLDIPDDAWARGDEHVL